MRVWILAEKGWLARLDILVAIRISFARGSSMCSPLVGASRLSIDCRA
jgi:hypothetical protein